MDVIKVLLREAPDAWRRALVVAGLAGLGNAAILAVINRGAALASSDLNLVNLRLLALFGFCMLAFFAGKRYALIQASVIVEHMVKDRLVRVTNKIRHSDLEVVENLGRGELFTKISQDTSLISQSGLILVNAAQQFLVLFFCLCYIAWLSMAAFLTTVLTIGIGSAVYFQHANSSQILLTRLKQQETALVDMLGHLIDGFKEIRLNRRKSDSVFRGFNDIANNVRDLKIDTQINFCVDMMFSDIVFYSLLASVVFLLPRLIPTYGTVVLMITSAILFITGPLQLVVQSAPVFQRAKAALANLGELEHRLDRGLVDRPKHARPIAYQGFQTIAFEGAVFTYASRENSNGSFSVGPLNFEIRRGETVFLVGGNGSGKTTLMKLLTGLYVPQRGALRIDHDIVDGQSIDSYRELFSTVFSQFHLFDRLYGLDEVDEALMGEILRDLDLTEKTSFANGRFTNLNLSTGQRKRLALAVTFLENKEILVFDEWAADQDPHFRQYFYEVVLRRLKEQGKTVIAVTHDDRYWGVADRVLKMEYGTLVDDHRN